MEAGESSISLGGIEERAAKLEEAVKVAATTSEATPETKVGDTPEVKTGTTVAGLAPVQKTEEKKAPNDPEELRKWNTKVSMELADVKKTQAETKKILETLAETLNKNSRKQVDWKDLAKDPVKLQTAIEEQRKQDRMEHEEKYNKANFESTSRITRLENERRKHDPKYPGWQELQADIIDLASKGDSRIDFTKDPENVLDQMYEIVKAARPDAVKVVAPVSAGKYTDADMAAAKETARKEALAEAQKGLAAEEKGAGVGGMGKGVAKGKGGVDKDALWNMPMKDLKSMIQKASE